MSNCFTMCFLDSRSIFTCWSIVSNCVMIKRIWSSVTFMCPCVILLLIIYITKLYFQLNSLALSIGISRSISISDLLLLDMYCGSFSLDLTGMVYFLILNSCPSFSVSSSIVYSGIVSSGISAMWFQDVTLNFSQCRNSSP